VGGEEIRVIVTQRLSLLLLSILEQWARSMYASCYSWTCLKTDAQGGSVLLSEAAQQAVRTDTCSELALGNGV
jgi:hypothetical protein